MTSIQNTVTVKPKNPHEVKKAFVGVIMMHDKKINSLKEAIIKLGRIFFI